jgi:hypothetical protein
MKKTMEVLVDNKWTELAKGKELFALASEMDYPIRVVHPNGSTKVIRNEDKIEEK